MAGAVFLLKCSGGQLNGKIAIYFAIEQIAGTGYGGWAGNLVEAAVAMLVWAALLTVNRNRKRKAALLAESAADDDEFLDG